MPCSRGAFKGTGQRLKKLLVMWMWGVNELPLRCGQRTGLINIGVVDLRDAGYWPTAESPPLATIKAMSRRGSGIAWLDISQGYQVCGQRLRGSGQEEGGLGKFNTDYWACLQTGLGLYIQNMLKSIKRARKAMESGAWRLLWDA